MRMTLVQYSKQLLRYYICILYFNITIKNICAEFITNIDKMLYISISIVLHTLEMFLDNIEDKFTVIARSVTS